MTVNEVTSKEFEVVKRGYDPNEVKGFLHQVSEEMKSLEAEKANLIKKLEVLARKVEEYKKDEESIQGALLGAQKLAKQTLSEAQERAEKLDKESKQKAEELILKTKTDSEKMRTDAQKFSQELVAKSRAEADKMVNEAKANVENTLRTSRYEIEKEQTNLLRTQKEVSKFKKDLLDVYRTHIDLIQKLPDSDVSPAKDEKVRELKKDIYKQKNSDVKAAPQAEDVKQDKESNSAAEAEKTDEPKEMQTAQGEAVKTEDQPAANAAPGGTEQSDPVQEPKQEKPFVNKFGELKFGSNSAE